MVAETALKCLNRTRRMNCRSTVSRGFSLTKTWLTGLLVVLLVALSVGSALHRDHGSDHAGQNTCAACLIAHGSLVADGAIGTTIVSLSQSFDLPSLGETKPILVSHLRLAPGRAPPV